MVGRYTTGNSFATKIDAQLGDILFSTRLGTVGGGPTFDAARAVAADSSGNVYFAGTTAAGFATTPGVPQPQAPTSDQTAGGIEHGFAMEISPAGDRVVYATSFSGATFVCAHASSPCSPFQPPFTASQAVILTAPSAIAVDATGAVTIAGGTNSTGLLVSTGAYGT